MQIRNYCETDVPTMVRIWNEVIEEGVAFPQLDFLDEESGKAFLLHKHTVLSRTTTEQSLDFIYFTRTILVVAVTLQMQAMLLILSAGENTLENSWFPTV